MKALLLTFTLLLFSTAVYVSTPVPTIIIFNEGEEVKRFQANIMMQLEATQDDIQEAVDEILMSSF